MRQTKQWSEMGYRAHPAATDDPPLYKLLKADFVVTERKIV